MPRLKIILTFVLLVCPWVVSYGQLHFAGVNGERGYAALRGSYRLDLDNGFILTPAVGYYRMSDKEEDEAGATTKFALSAAYEITDNLVADVVGAYIPRRLGFENWIYGAGLTYTLCYRCGPLKNPYIRAQGGQALYDITDDRTGQALPSRFKTTATAASLEAGSELGKFWFQARYDKVIKYTHKPPQGVTSNWTEIPYMTAVVQGFISDMAAARVAYRTRWISPYAVYARYKYLEYSDYTISVAGGLALHLGQATISGGVEIFEQNRQDHRKTYFFMSASTEF